ncbi:MAG: YmfQ family protein, partial [Treponema sp.]|nr:YmfQ family protein [Treponema sp.]
MSRPFMRHVTDALMPKGTIWRPCCNGDFDKLFDGVSENKQVIFNDLSCLAYIRDPYRCPIELLPDLERELGISSNIALAEIERRASVAVVRYKRRSLATAQKLQRALETGRFGYGGHGLIVTPNSPPMDPSIITGGYFLKSGDDCKEIYTLPKPYWPLVFFIGGAVTRNPSGQI